MKGKRLELTLPVDFTQEELDDRRDRLSSAALRYDAVEEEKKTSNAHFTDQLKALRGEVSVPREGNSAEKGRPRRSLRCPVP
jgi:hypothetical protein